MLFPEFSLWKPNFIFLNFSLKKKEELISSLVEPEKNWVSQLQLIFLTDLVSVGVEYIRNYHNYNNKPILSSHFQWNLLEGKLFIFFRLKRSQRFSLFCESFSSFPGAESYPSKLWPQAIDSGFLLRMITFYFKDWLILWPFLLWELLHLFLWPFGLSWLFISYFPPKL